MKKEMQILAAFAAGFILVLSNGILYVQGFKTGYNRAIEAVIDGSRAQLKARGYDPEEFDKEFNELHSREYD